MGREAKVFYALSELISDKYDHSFSETMAWVNRKMRFEPLLRTTVIYLHGSWSRKNIFPLEEDFKIGCYILLLFLLGIFIYLSHHWDFFFLHLYICILNQAKRKKTAGKNVFLAKL